MLNVLIAEGVERKVINLKVSLKEQTMYFNLILSLF